jgi:type II secretory pathway pseudopilin PulG
MALKRGGFTLIEMIVYCSLFLLVVALLAQLFTLSRRTQQTTASAYAVTGETDTAMHWLRRDLQDTALSSINVAGSGKGMVTQTVTMASARSPEGGSNSRRSIVISEYGVPAWSSHVFYGIEQEPDSLTGNLVRWEVPMAAADKTRIPRVAKLLNTTSSPRVVLRNVLNPTQTVHGLDGLATGWPSGPYGGFRVQFVQRLNGEDGVEHLTSDNPSSNLEKAANNTRLVEVELTVSEPSGGAPNLFSVKFRVCPRY